MDPHVYHHHPRPHHVPRYALGVACRDDKDVGHSGDAGQVPGPEVAYRHRRVGPRLLLEQQRGQWSAHYQAAPDQHHVFPLRVVPHRHKHPVYPCRRARHKARLPRHQPAHVKRVQPLNVLKGIDGVYDLQHVDAAGHWELDQDAVEPIVRVQLIDLPEQFGLGCVAGQPEGLGVNARLLRRLLLRGDVPTRGGVIRYKHHCQAGHHTRLRAKFLHGVLHAQSDVLGYPAAIDYPCGHSQSPSLHRYCHQAARAPRPGRRE